MILRFGRVDSFSFLVGWALPTTTCGEGRRTASIAVVKSNINSLLTPCNYNILKKLDLKPTSFDYTQTKTQNIGRHSFQVLQSNLWIR